MRSFLVAFTALTLLASAAAQAKVAITVDKDNQQMTVAVDGVARYTWPVSSGLPSYETPNGSFRAFRMEEDHYSKEFDDAPMPHSIFFTKIGHAIHGMLAADHDGWLRRLMEECVASAARLRMAACGCRASMLQSCSRW